MALKFAQVLSRHAPAARYMSGGPVWFTEDKSVIGTREIVGFGMNGSPMYYDNDASPMPSIRYREEDSQVKAIREKEKGDWKKLTLEEKKALYRFSFCQTFSEFQAPSGDWKYIVGWTFVVFSLAYGMGLGFEALMPMDPQLEHFYDYDARVASEQRRLDMGIFRERGLAVDWDVEKRDWKK